MKRFLTEFFYYTRTERVGVMALLIICLFLFALPWILPWFKKTPAVDDGGAYQQAWTAFRQEAPLTEHANEAENKKIRVDVNKPTREQLMALKLPDKTVRSWISYTRKGGHFDDYADLARFRGLAAADLARIRPQLIFPPERQSAKQHQQTSSDKPREAVLYPFNPNTASPEQLDELGFPRAVAGNIIRYRQRGGVFRRPEDVQKLYGLTESDFNRIKPYLVFKKDGESEASGEESAQRYTPITIDINTADEETWQRLRGIGPTLSRRIVKFRDRLGGFTHVGQVGETFGLADSTFQQILPQLKESPIVKPIPINTVDAATLSTHPYLNYRLANAIISYRQQHGPFNSQAELSKVMALPKETLEKLAPYLVY